ncbi:hypothetical protein OAG56_05740 [Mariniblastus sp.]|nr:hypothetical protein [Mariniblastus sp.]MDB4756857.1 hypothetical protein [Mariniblastus sp.]
MKLISPKPIAAKSGWPPHPRATDFGDSFFQRMGSLGCHPGRFTDKKTESVCENQRLFIVRFAHLVLQITILANNRIQDQS